MLIYAKYDFFFSFNCTWLHFSEIKNNQLQFRVCLCIWKHDSSNSFLLFKQSTRFNCSKVSGRKKRHHMCPSIIAMGTEERRSQYNLIGHNWSLSAGRFFSLFVCFRSRLQSEKSKWDTKSKTEHKRVWWWKKRHEN